MATKRISNRNTEEKYLALQNELEMLQDELDNNELQQEELRGIAEGLEQRITVLEDELEEKIYNDEDEE